MDFGFILDKAKQAAKFSAIVSSVITTLLVIINEFIPDFETLLPWLNSFISNGIIPLLIILCLALVLLQIRYQKSLT
ncbi:MAG: hypothetical protein MZV64_07295 [Ignavibacteriales bacterium]|nr:hypothetical protein [Ignavibacteriales bacterium]